MLTRSWPTTAPSTPICGLLAIKQELSSPQFLQHSAWLLFSRWWMEILTGAIVRMAIRGAPPPAGARAGDFKACGVRSNPERCIMYITGGDGWDLPPGLGHQGQEGMSRPFSYVSCLKVCSGVQYSICRWLLWSPSHGPSTWSFPRSTRPCALGHG